MTSMSHDPAAAVIGAQTIEIGARALAAAAAAAPTVTGLAPAGAEEVSAQAAAAFAAEAAAVLAAHTAAQDELMRAGAALIDIARMYEQVDVEAAGTMVSSASEFSNQVFATGAAGLARAATLPGARGSAARTPLVANLIEGVAASNPSATVPAVANAASTAMSAGTAPLSSISSIGQGGASAGGAAGPAAASTLTGDDRGNRDDSDDSDDQQPSDRQPGEQLL